MKHQFKTLLLVSLLLVAGCNDTPLVEEESNNTQRTFTLSASMPGSGDHATRVAGEQDPASLDIVLKWKTGDEIQLYFKVGNTITLGDKVEVHDISADGKTAQFDVDVTGISGNFDLYGVHGTSSETNGSAILLDVAPDNFVKLEDARVPLYFIKKDFDLNSPDQTVDFEHLGALQVITFKNTGNGEITLGSPSLSFTGTDKWYYDANGTVVPVFDIVSQPSTATTKSGTFTPEQFTPVNISPNDNIMLAQWIMPNGNTPPEINFTAEIGGAPKDTPDPKGSRSSALQIGKAYHLYVQWDGTNLSFAEEVYKITMTTSSSDQLQLLIDAEPEDRNDVWIDLNKNGVRDAGEDVVFGDIKNYTINFSTVTLYGKVTSLDCSDNELEALDVTKNPELTELYCSENSLQELDVTKNPKLTILSCYDNYLPALDVSGNPALTKLDCSENSLTALLLTNNSALENLVCYMNNINGNAMDELIGSLPTRSQNDKGSFSVIVENDPYEGNVCTIGQVDSANNTKFWDVLNSVGDPYLGS